MARSTAHRPEQHKRSPVKVYCRVATTANITIATALNSGDTIDGVTLATGDRVLVKDQSAGAENGIYVVAAVPARAYDMDTAAEVLGILVLVIAGTVNAATLWKTTNTTAVTLGTTAIVFAQVGSSPSNAELNIEGGQSVIHAHGAMGATETFDPTLGNVHTGTLDANCTFTISAPVGSGAATLVFWITGSGTRTWTWPGSVTWLAGVAPDPPADTETVVVVLTSVDGGTNWVGGPWGGGAAFATPAIVLGTAAAAGAADTVIRSDATIVAFDATLPESVGTAATGSATVAARRDHVHAGAASGLGPLLLASDHPVPLVFDDILQASDGADFLYASEP